MVSLEEINFSHSDGYVYVQGRERLHKIAQELDYPSFLLEVAALENKNSRRFARDKKTHKIHLIIDFDLLTNENLCNLSQRSRWSAIPGFILCDHIHPSDIKHRLLHTFVGSPTSTCPRESLLEGKASDNAFPMWFNDINIVDPFLHLSDRFMMYENGEFFQWKFAELEKSNTHPNQSAFFSNEVDLAAFKRVSQDLWENLQKQDQVLSALTRLYQKLATERQKILDALKDIHISRITKGRGTEINTSNPPRLGRFDYLYVSENGYQVSTDLSPLLFRAALSHLFAVRKLENTECFNESVLLETVPGILMTYLCLDSYVNVLGSNLKLPNWGATIESSLESKIGAITKNTERASLLKKRPDVKRKIEEITTLRHELIHYKHKFYQIIEVGGERVSEFHTRAGIDKLESTLKNVREIIKLIHKYIELPAPLWLEKRADWLEDTDPKRL